MPRDRLYVVGCYCVWVAFGLALLSVLPSLWE